MTRDEAIAIIRKEYLCVDRDCGIEKKCGKCDLVMPSKEPILEAFKMAIEALEQELYGDAISRHDAIFLAGELRHDLPDDDDRLAATVMAHNEGILEYQTKLSLLPSINQEPCDVPDTNAGDMISRQAAIDAVKAIKFGLWEIDIPSPTVPEYREHHEQVTELMGVCDCWIKKLTEYHSVQPKVGRWIENVFEQSREFWDATTTCSECGYKLGGGKPNFCPNCGARMEEVEG